MTIIDSYDDLATDIAIAMSPDSGGAVVYVLTSAEKEDYHLDLVRANVRSRLASEYASSQTIRVTDSEGFIFDQLKGAREAPPFEPPTPEQEAKLAREAGERQVIETEIFPRVCNLLPDAEKLKEVITLRALVIIREMENGRNRARLQVRLVEANQLREALSASQSEANQLREALSTSQGEANQLREALATSRSDLAALREQDGGTT